MGNTFTNVWKEKIGEEAVLPLKGWGDSDRGTQHHEVTPNAIVGDMLLNHFLLSAGDAMWLNLTKR